MERPIFKEVNTPVMELDTPSLIVDISIMEDNIETLHSFFRKHKAKVRPHVGSHKCPMIAHKQLAAGGTVNGICVATIGEAEVFAQNGFDDIFITNKVVTPIKIYRVCMLARHSKIRVAVDSYKNINDLSAAAENIGVTINVVVDIHTRLESCGVEPGHPALDLARSIIKAKNLHFSGLMSNEGIFIGYRQNELESESRKWFQLVLDTRELLEKENIKVEHVCVGSTQNYEIAGNIDGVTEVPAGSYTLLDYRYNQFGSLLKPAAKVLSTVTSCPDKETIIIDCGEKAISADRGLPVVELPGITLVSLSAEHGILKVRKEETPANLDLGDRVWLIPSDIGSCINVHDYINVVREKRLEALWKIEARGLYR